MMVRMESQLEKMEAMVEINQEEVNATDLEANPEEIKSETEHEEVPKEKTAVEIFGASSHRALSTAEEKGPG
jgi:hypothetical protein